MDSLAEIFVQKNLECVSLRLGFNFKIFLKEYTPKSTKKNSLDRFYLISKFCGYQNVVP